jgi:two-component system NtrC family response regulator
MHKILIVDDDDALRRQMKWALRDAYDVLEAADRPDAIRVFTSDRPRVVLLDLGLPPRPNDTSEGMHTLSELLELAPQTKVIIITGQSEKEHALDAIGHGAYDFLTKPADDAVIRVILDRAFHVATLEEEFRALQADRDQTFEGMAGSSPQIDEVFAYVRRLATTDAPVLIQGESGTGKEIAARAIHRQSRRKAGPFIPINCGAVPETLMEGELFGHEKGSFTGAHTQRVGRFEMAHGGTLFLDEIGELILPMQVKLLRFLQDRRIERIGGRKEIEVDARVIAATNRDLQAAQHEGAFREDLYYRLAVVTVKLPPLRERKGDASLLAKVFLRRFAREDGRDITGFSPEAVDAIEAYPWPGNVRELENRVKRAVVMAEHKRITPADLELPSATPSGLLPQLKDAREQVERNLLSQALERYDGNISRAAEALGISRPTLYELMSKLGIEKPG